MPIQVDLSSLVNLRESMGAPLGQVDLQTATLPPLTTTFEQDLDRDGYVVFDDEDIWNHITIEGGLLALGDRHVTLNILQPFCAEEPLSEVPANGPNVPRFHMADCRTLEHMRESGLGNRYVISQRREAQFRVQPFIEETQVWGEVMFSNLVPCRNCLSALDYEGWRNLATNTRSVLVDNFDLEQFFVTFRPIFRCLPLYTVDNYPGGNYTADFARISLQFRRSKNWRCDCCQLDLSDHRGLLHVHHIDHIRANNVRTN